MNRRGFIGSILALAAAPAIVRADSLMRIVPVDTVIAPVMREDLSDIIWDISPMETPFISASRKNVEIARRIHEIGSGVAAKWRRSDGLSIENIARGVYRDVKALKRGLEFEYTGKWRNT